MYISVIGHERSGKTMLFQALSGVQTAQGFSDTDNIISIDVPDERVDELTRIFNPKKSTYARIELADTVAIEEGNLKDSTISAKTLQKMRMSDAFILVLKYFEGATQDDLEKDFHGIVSEFILADMVQIENRLERIKRQAGKKENMALLQEEALLNQCLAHVNDGKPMAVLDLSDGDWKALKGFRFLSLKSMMIVVNCSEDNMPEASAAAEKLALTAAGYPVIYACARLESELAMMGADEQADFMAEFALEESIRVRMIRLAFDTLGLISFLTVGDDECRAWPIRKGINAQEAAGAIHSDLAARFIRAETVSYSDFMKHGGIAECKKAGVWRLEGKTYIVADGDIISVRAGN